MLKGLIRGSLGAAVVAAAVGCAPKSYHDIERSAAPAPWVTPGVAPAPQAAPGEAYPVIVQKCDRVGNNA